MMKNDYLPLFSNAKAASRKMCGIPGAKINEVLCQISDSLINRPESILRANSLDLEKMSKDSPLYDRLRLTPQRLEDIAADMRKVASLPSPVGDTLETRTLPNGLLIERVRVPFGVVGVIYEARPNVTFDVFSLCLKTGNVCVLKGGKDAENSNIAIVKLIKQVLSENNIDDSIITLLPSSHETTYSMLNAVGYIDVCIPRGGRKLIDFVRDNAHVPVIETGAGVVSTYFHASGDVEMGCRIIENAKTRRVSVCNSLDTLLIDTSRLDDLPYLLSPLAPKNVILYCDEKSFATLQGHYPSNLLKTSDHNTWETEWMDYKMGVKTVGSVEEAICHISEYGSGHSEAIICNDSETAIKFRTYVDAACVYVNAPTSFTDGAQFGLGAEIGISTQKLGPRGPMGLSALTTYKWLISGKGQIRE